MPDISLNYDIRFRARRSVLFGVLVMVAGVVVASVSSPWWLLLLPIGVTSIFRLETNVALATLADMKRSGLPVLVLGPRFHGVLHGRFCRGTTTLPQVSCFAEGREAPVENATGAAPGKPGIRKKPWTPGFSVAIDDIASVHSSSGEKTIRLGLRDRIEEIDCTMLFERDEVLKLLRPACAWSVETTRRKVFRIDLRSWIFCLPLTLFAATIALTAVGLVQPHQLPLADWKDVGGMQPGRGRGLAVLWVLASQAYRFVIEQCPPVVAGIVGLVGMIAFGALLAILQWTWLTDETWTNPRSTGKHKSSETTSRDQLPENSARGESPTPAPPSRPDDTLSYPPEDQLSLHETCVRCRH